MWIIGGIAVAVILVLAIPAFQASHVNSALAAQWQEGLNADKQTLFDDLHFSLGGTATSVSVDDLTIDSWKPGHSGNTSNDVQAVTVRFTLYWQGKVEHRPDLNESIGYTKVEVKYNYETDAASLRVLDTNGHLKEDLNRAMEKAAFDFGRQIGKQIMGQ
ncbi:MAG TPA: hypothetical protein VFE46_06200 [Pirellulales bacterium]|jgi:hypothetical protein|nr:hypothetical protein [Pirellulales bacterium]